LSPSLFDTTHHFNDPYFPPVTTSNIGWNPPSARPSTHLGVTIATNDPWSTETTGRSSAVATNDPWQG
ncbi:unnamed protein product, partial [Rotaria magnacalcarata]